MVIPKTRHVLVEKYNTKIGPKTRFLDLISYGLIVKVDVNQYPNSIFLFNEDSIIFEYYKKNNTFWCSYDRIWSIFEREYSLNYQEISDLIKHQVEKHFKIKGVTPPTLLRWSPVAVEKHFKIKGVTPAASFFMTGTLVEKHFKIKGVTPDSESIMAAVKVEKHFKIKGVTPQSAKIVKQKRWKSILKISTL